MIGILGEDRSDVEMLRVLLRRLCQTSNLSIRGVGFSGLRELLTKGHRQVTLLQDLGCRWIIVCCDADGEDPGPKQHLLRERVFRGMTPESTACTVVAVQEIEAWILANLSALAKVFTGWRPKDMTNPEAVPEPKETLVRLSRDRRSRARFSSTLHNASAAEVLDLDLVAKRCPSFRAMAAFVKDNMRPHIGRHDRRRRH